MKILGYFLNVSRFYSRAMAKRKSTFIISTVWSIIASVIIYAFITFSLNCFELDIGFGIKFDDMALSIGKTMALVLGIILLVASVLTIIRNIPYQIVLTIAGFKRYKEDGSAFIVCAILSLITLIVLIVSVALLIFTSLS